MDIHGYPQKIVLDMDMDMDAIIHLHGKPVNFPLKNSVIVDGVTSGPRQFSGEIGSKLDGDVNEYPIVL